jgi:hypothetical protein
MKTEFEHKYNIGDTVYVTRYQQLEELEICGIAFDLFFDGAGDEQIHQNVSYRTEGNFYINEKYLFTTKEEAETQLGIGTRQHLEQKIAIAETHIKNHESYIKEWQEKLAKLP